MTTSTGKNRIIIFKEKHSTRVFLIDTDEKLFAVSLKILRERYEEGWFYEPEEPEKPVEALLTPEQKARLGSLILSRTEGVLKNYEEDLREYEREKRVWDQTKRALKTSDGKMAYGVLHSRQDGEYEGWSIEYLEELANE